MSLKDKYDEFEIAFVEAWGEYAKLQDELSLYRGKKLTDAMVPIVNEIIRKIQEKFVELYPVFIFIRERYKFASNAVYEYNKFIDDIKAAGGSPNHEAQA